MKRLARLLRFSRHSQTLTGSGYFLRLVSCCAPGTRASIDTDVDPEGCACVGELGQDLGIVPSTISHHIKELRRAGLIRMERRGQKIECWIDPETVAALREFFS